MLNIAHYYRNANQNYNEVSTMRWEMGIPDHLTCLLRILKEISPEYSLEGLMLKLKLVWPPYVKS